MIIEIRNDLKKLINLYKEKPYLPFWGELFFVLQRLKKEVDKNTQSNLFLYEMEISVSVFYQPIDGKFCIMHPDFNISLTQEEYIDSILKGRFWPK
ncbi:hypothetical protein ACIQD3_04530 [Peribacillus loiseleuriae]|uniref:hypothetical protein n=1 Tax=Peribacillus loiseleuriae TaxID=1679170 RepID=UPI003803C5C8